MVRGTAFWELRGIGAGSGDGGLEDGEIRVTCLGRRNDLGSDIWSTDGAYETREMGR